jgi:hypothetical protein
LSQGSSPELRSYSRSSSFGDFADIQDPQPNLIGLTPGRYVYNELVSEDRNAARGAEYALMGEALHVRHPSGPNPRGQTRARKLEEEAEGMQAVRDLRAETWNLAKERQHLATRVEAVGNLLPLRPHLARRIEKVDNELGPLATNNLPTYNSSNINGESRVCL